MIDLIRSPEDPGNRDLVEIIDFKSEKKPDLVKEAEKIDRYKKQLQVYAHLVEQNTGKKVKKLHLYYTGEESGCKRQNYRFYRDKKNSYKLPFKIKPWRVKNEF